MDISTILGFLCGLVAIGGALFFMASHGGGHVNLAGFIDPPAIMLVIGGALTVALVGFPLKRVFALAVAIKKALFYRPEDAAELIEQIVKLAEVARRDGLLALENKAKEIENPFVALGIQMAVDGIKPETVEEVMRTEIEAMQARHHEGKKVMETIGRCGPAFGLVATLLGLILMLGNLSNAESIGPSMAMALIGTLYGVATANFIAIPLAEKLGCFSHEETLIKEIIVRGVLAIQSGDSPRIVQQKLNTFLPPKLRPGSEEEAA
ncbi:MAG: motility protein A [Thermoguttaceae bacterium]